MEPETVVETGSVFKTAAVPRIFPPNKKRETAFEGSNSEEGPRRKISWIFVDEVADQQNQWRHLKRLPHYQSCF